MLRFSIGKTTIEICFSFLAVFAVLMSLCGEKTLILSLITAILHELGHLSFMYIFKVKINKLVFYASGIKIKYDDKTNLKLYKRIAIILGGCLVNFIFFTILYFITYKPFILSDFMFINLALGIFNLLPVKFFDGGKLLKLICENLFTSYKIIRIIENTVSVACIIFLIIASFMIGITNFSLYLTLLYFLLAIFIM